MSKIITMDATLSNRIAAGEVVERPSGVLKELIENAIDAGSSSIRIETMNGGLESILVSDNGEGMDEEDLKKAFLRHSTSKIKNEFDLYQLKTLGFRGEALPSIASVAKVIASSHHREIVIDNGQQISFKATQQEVGFTIEVRELFYKTPARLKYLKTPSYEASRNLSLIQQFALGFPHISFYYSNDQRPIFETSGNGKVEEVLYLMYGHEIASQTTFFSQQNQDFKVSGYYVTPHIYRGTRYHMYIYLNQRLIRYSKVTKVISDLFHRYMPIDRYPILVLNIESDVQLVDVNVHPNKWEVRVSKEAQLLDLIEAVFNQSLHRKTEVKEIKPSVIFEKPLELNLFQEEFIQPNVSQTVDVMTIQEEKVPEQVPLITPIYQPIRALAQHHGNYILAQDETSLYIFDQHASMERIQYEKFLEKFKQQTFSQQTLLEPILIQHDALSPEKMTLLATTYGLWIEAFSEGTLILRQVPTWMEKLNIESFVMSVLDLLQQQRSIAIEEVLRKKIATLACHSSIRFNESHSLLQLQTIIDNLLKCDNPYHCPHGRPTYIKVSASELMKEFSR